jgi:hypothetical protein
MTKTLLVTPRATKNHTRISIHVSATNGSQPSGYISTPRKLLLCLTDAYSPLREKAQDYPNQQHPSIRSCEN